jgi:hypothetical protein
MRLVRILMMGIGGIIGFAVGYVLLGFGGIGAILMDHLSSRIAQLLLLGVMGGCTFGGGYLFMFLGEKTGLIPSQEEVDRKAKPTSLFDGH